MSVPKAGAHAGVGELSGVSKGARAPRADSEEAGTGAVLGTYKEMEK